MKSRERFAEMIKRQRERKKESREGGKRMNETSEKSESKEKEGSRNREEVSKRKRCRVGNWTSKHDLIIDVNFFFMLTFSLCLCLSLSASLKEPHSLPLWFPFTFRVLLRKKNLTSKSFRRRLQRWCITFSPFLLPHSPHPCLSLFSIPVFLTLSLSFTLNISQRFFCSGYGSEKRRRGSFNPRTVVTLLSSFPYSLSLSHLVSPIFLFPTLTTFSHIRPVTSVV